MLKTYFFAIRCKKKVAYAKINRWEEHQALIKDKTIE